MLESLGFNFDGMHSSQLGILNVYVEAGLFQEVFLPTRAINEVVIRGRDIPYLQGVSLSPLEFPVKIAFEEGFDSQKIREVARGLCKD